MRKYEGMYSRAGVLDDRSTGMEWIDPDYDSRTFEELTRDAQPESFLRHLMDILVIDTPNIIVLSHSLGELFKEGNQWLSKKLYNPFLRNAVLSPFENSRFNTETARIQLEFIDEVFSFESFKKVLNDYKFKLIGNSTEPVEVKSSLVPFKANLILSVRVQGLYLVELTIQYIVI